MKLKWMSALLLPLCFAASQAAEEEFAQKTINIGMIVSDLEKSMSFYKDIIGFIQDGRTEFEVDGDFGKKAGLTDSIGLHVQVLKLGKGEGATELKLMTFGDKAKKQENEFISDHTGVQYLTIMVTELEPILARIKEHKVKLLGETPIPAGPDRYFAMVKDPDGTFVELIGPMKKAQ